MASVLLLVQYLYRTDGVAERCGPEASKETGYCALLKATTGHFLSLSFAFAASPSCQVPGKTRMDPGRAIVPFILKGKKKKKTGVESQSKHVFYYLLFSSFDPLFLGFKRPNLKCENRFLDLKFIVLRLKYCYKWRNSTLCLVHLLETFFTSHPSCSTHIFRYEVIFKLKSWNKTVSGTLVRSYLFVLVNGTMFSWWFLKIISAEPSNATNVVGVELWVVGEQFDETEMLIRVFVKTNTMSSWALFFLLLLSSGGIFRIRMSIERLMTRFD